MPGAPYPCTACSLQACLPSAQELPGTYWHVTCLPRVCRSDLDPTKAAERTSPGVTIRCSQPGCCNAHISTGNEPLPACHVQVRAHNLLRYQLCYGRGHCTYAYMSVQACCQNNPEPFLYLLACHMVHEVVCSSDIDPTKAAEGTSPGVTIRAVTLVVAMLISQQEWALACMSRACHVQVRAHNLLR